MDKLEIYHNVQAVPENAQKKIEAGRLKGFTDINPMWRILKLTEMFGPCGMGWKVEIVNQHVEEGANGTKTAHVGINLFVRTENGEWSEAIPGVGGASYISQERNGLYVSDECFKMAFTDAISVACKMLGFGADVYWSSGRTKYDTQSVDAHQAPTIDRNAVNAAVVALMKSFSQLRGKTIGEVENALMRQISAPTGASLSNISDELAVKAKAQMGVWVKAAKEQSNEAND